MKTQPKTNRVLSLFATGLFAFAGITANLKAQAPNLIAYWDFNKSGSSVIDSVAGIKGEVIGTTIFSRPGHTGKDDDKCINFGQSPAGNWIKINHENNLWLSPASKANQLSVSFWQQLYAKGNSSSFWFGAGSAPGWRNAQAHVPWGNNSNIYWDTAGCCGEGVTRINKSWDGDVTAWNHFVFVKDGNRKAIYVNGELLHEGQNITPLFDDWNIAAIGSNNSGAASIAGKVDDFAVYASALSDDDIRALAGGKAPDQLMAPTVVGGDAYYTVLQLLSKDYSTVQEETRNGQDRIVITGIFPTGDEIAAGVMERDWCVTLPAIEFEKLNFGGGSLCINLDEQTISGEASCEPAFLGGASIAGNFTVGREGLRDIGLVADEMGILIGTTPAMLQKIGASLENLHLNPGWSVTGNLGISVGKEKIADEWPVYVDSYATWDSNGYLEITSELQVIGITTGAGVLRYTPAESSFYAEAWMDMYGGTLTGTVMLNARPDYFNGHFGMVVKIPNAIPVIGGVNFGGADADMTITDTYWEVAAGVWFQLTPDVPEVCVPEKCVTVGYPEVHVKCSWRGCKTKNHWHESNQCTPAFCSPAIDNSWSKAKFNVRYHSKDGFTASQRGRLAKMYSENQAREPWENPFVAIIEVPEEKAYAIFNDNWDILHESVTKSGSRSIQKQGPVIETIEVTENLATAIFRISFEKDADDIDLVLITPDGVELDIHDGPMPFGYEVGAKGTGTVNAEAKEAYYLLQDVKAGTYQMVIGNAEALGGTLVELASPNAIPQVLGAVASESGARDGTVIPNQFDIDWAYFDEDEGSETVVSFFVDKDRQGYDGFYVGGGLVSEMDTDEPFTFLTDSLGIRPGWYYSYVEVNDGRNLAERIYSDERIYIDMDDAPDSVEQMATLAGPNSFTVAWDAVSDKRVDYYNVVYSKSPTFDKIEASQVVYPLDGQTQFSDVKIEGLENGVPVYVAVLSVGGDFIESSAKVIHRVVPTNYPGGTPPAITSEARDKATVGYDWNYRPTFFDGDEHNPELIDDLTQQGRTVIDWALVSAPNGMEIDKASGLIRWKPTAEQEGVHRVIISAKEHEGEADPLDEGEFEIDYDQEATQEIEITVFPPHLLNGVPYREDVFTFISDPQLTAIKGTTYSYTPNVFTDEQTYEVILLNGPEGVIVENNVLTWDVPADAESDYIELRAETDNGDIIDQTYFVHVHGDNSLLKRSTTIVKYEALNGGILIGWTGGAAKYQVQHASTLTPDATTGFVQWENVGEPSKNSAVNFHVEKSTTGKAGYYRIKDLE
jgi:hypothetical protein